MTQTLSDLMPEDAERLEKQRDLVVGYLDAEGLEALKGVRGKLGTLGAFLDAEIFHPDQTYALQSLGVILGDAFVQDLGFHWIMVSDEFGRDPAIRYRETSVLLFPLTMISKRLERGEIVDVYALYDGVAELAHGKIDAELNGKGG